MRLKQHHAWLFTFTDLAFLLVISLSLIPSAPKDVLLHFSTMDVPSVPVNPNLSPIRNMKEVWELHVHSGTPDTHPAPFKLVRLAIVQGGSEALFSKYLQQDELVRELEVLRERDIRPVLLPSKMSLTQDFLFAAGAIAQAWDNARSETIVKHVNPEEEDKR